MADSSSDPQAPRLPAIDGVEQAAPCAEMLRVVQHLIQGAADTTGQLAQELGEQGGRLATNIGQLKQQREHQEVMRLLGLIVAQTETIQGSVETSRRELAETRDALREVQRELLETRQLLNEDPLTGALNRRGLEQTLAREIARAQRHDSKLSVAMVDLDHFKRLNDSYGHEVGDQWLVHFANLAKSVMRKSDALVRYGGEEFSLLLPDTDVRGAMFVLGRLKMLVGKSPLAHQGHYISTTFSAGIAMLKGDENGHALLNRADQALYFAKQSGRDCIKLAG